MKVLYRLNGFTETEAETLRRRLEKKRVKIKRICGRADGDSVVLRLNARQGSESDQGARIALSLTLRKCTLFADRRDPNASNALDRALEALLEEIRTFRAHVFYQKQRRRHLRVGQEFDSARPYLAEQAREQDREFFEDRLRPLLAPIRKLAVNEIQDREVAGELPPDAADADEVLDEVVARAYEALQRDTIALPLKTWLVAATHAYLDEVQDRCLREPHETQRLHLDDAVVHDDPMDIRAQGDEQLDFHQPDEVLLVEDILPDLALADPAEHLSAREQMRFVHKALRALPRRQRQSFLLHADGFDDMEIAMIQNRAEEQVRTDIATARKTILARLAAEA